MIKKVKILLFFCLTTSISMSCADKRTHTNKELCLAFYKLNKGKHFDTFYDVRIDSRMESKFDDSSGQNSATLKHVFLFDIAANQYLYLPVYQLKSSTQQKITAYKKCGNDIKRCLQIQVNSLSHNSCFDSYVHFVDAFLTQYDLLKTPKFYNNRSVLISGKPSLGNFIEFRLNAKAKCYYLKDRNNLIDNWSKFFNDSRKIDEHWYFDTKN